MLRYVRACSPESVYAMRSWPDSKSTTAATLPMSTASTKAAKDLPAGTKISLSSRISRAYMVDGFCMKKLGRKKVKGASTSRRYSSTRGGGRLVMLNALQREEDDAADSVALGRVNKGVR